MKNNSPRNAWERIVKSAILDRFDPPPPELRRWRAWQIVVALVGAVALWWALR